MTFLIVFLCFFTAGILLLNLLFTGTGNRNAIRRMRLISGQLGILEKELSFTEKLQQKFQPVLFPLQPFFNHLTALSGKRSPWFYAMPVLGIFFVSLIMLSSFNWLLQVASSFGLSFLSAWLLYRYLAKQQKQAFEEQLPAVIDQLARAVSTGMSVPQAIAACAQQATEPVRPEMERLSGRLSIGVEMTVALQEARQRIPVEEFSFLSVILILNQQTGGRLSHALENLSAGLRERKALRMKMATLTSEPRAAANIVSLFPPLTMAGLAYFNPAQWNFLWEDPSGQKILVYTVTSVIIGMLIIHRMARGET